MTGDLLQDLQLSLEFETAKQRLAAAKTVRGLVDAWWECADKFEGEPRAELQAIYDTRLAALGVTAAA